MCPNTNLPDSGDFQPGDTVYSLCHNCSAILEESKPGVIVTSLWEYIAADGSFPLPELTGRTMILQDCWRAFDRTGEQDAVRTLLQRMGVSITELPDNREQTNFCGVSVLRPAPPRNLKLAPQRFSRNANAQDKFRPYTPDGLPMLGETAALKGFYMAAGHEGDGIALSPITGKLIAELIAEGKPSYNIDVFSPNRFLG